MFYMRKGDSYERNKQQFNKSEQCKFSRDV